MSLLCDYDGCFYYDGCFQTMLNVEEDVALRHFAVWQAAIACEGAPPTREALCCALMKAYAERLGCGYGDR